MPMPRFRHSRSAQPTWQCRQKWKKGSRSGRCDCTVARIRCRRVIGLLPPGEFSCARQGLSQVDGIGTHNVPSVNDKALGGPAAAKAALSHPTVPAASGEKV